MKSPSSVSRRLTQGVTWIGVLGGLALIVSVSLDVDDLLEERSARAGWHGEWLEIAEHVVMPLVVLMIPMFVAVRWMIRRSLAPLGIAASRIDSVRGSERGFRLELGDLPLEVRPFAIAINSLLERLELTAQEREAFVADAAHELRTPLAILMLQLDELAVPETAKLKEELAALTRLVDQLMLMAQVEAHAMAPVPRSSIGLNDVATDVAIFFAPIAARQGKHLELRIDGPATVRGVKEAIDAAIGNLVENGLRATPVGGTVVIWTAPGRRIGVSDGGPGLTAAQLARYSCRFAKGEHASQGGAGLGLAIVSRIAENHQASLCTAPRRREIFLAFPED